MAKLSEKALRKRDAARDIGAELLASVREMKAGKAGHVHRVPVSAITEARTRTGLSRQQSAKVLGLSTRTLQECSKADANLRTQHAFYLRLQHDGPEC